MSTFRSSVVVTKQAKHSKSSVSCESLMLDDRSRSDTIPAMDTQSSEYNGKMWNYFSYNMEELSGYRVWVELSDGDVFACTVEWIGEEETPDDIDTVIKTLSSCIADYDV